MESLNSSTLNVVLKIKDGSGFGFLTSPFIITCSLNGNALTTDPIGGPSNSTFENEFVWEAEKKFLRSMRSNNYSIRVECFCDSKHKKHDKIGYILLNMKQQAQIVSASLGTNIVYHWHKLLGVRSDVKTFKPEMLLSLYIKEADFELNSKTPKTPPPVLPPSNKIDEVENKDIVVPPVPFVVPAAEPVNMPIETTMPNNTVQLGSPRETDYHFKLCVRITSINNLSSCLKDLNGVNDLKIEFALFGNCFKTSDLLDKYGQLNDECVIITIKSQVETLMAYFNQFPNIKFLLQSSSKTVANAPFVMKTLLARDNFDQLVNEKVSVIQDEASLNFSNDAHINVLVSMEAEKVKMNNPIKPFTVANTIKKGENVESKQQNKSNFKGILCKSKSNVQEVQNEINSSNDLNDSTTSNVKNIVCDNNGQQCLNNIPNAMPSDVQTMKQLTDVQNFINSSQNPPPQFVYPYFPPTFPNLQDGRGDSYEIISPRNVSESVKNKVAEELAKKTYKELEEWKEKQKETYKADLKKKLDKEIKRLTAEWLSRQRELELEATTNIEESVTLSQQLHSTSAELKFKLDSINKQQAELENEKKELEKKYSEKHLELREASKKHQAVMQEQITALKGELEELKAKNCSLLKENEMLKTSQQSCGSQCEHSVRSSHSKTSHLTDQQMTTLLVDMKSLEEKLSAALESKEFFRKEWSRALREIHRMKTEQEEQVRLQLQTQRQELDNLRLVGLITAEEKSSKEDFASIKDLKNQIVRLNTPKISQ